MQLQKYTTQKHKDKEECATPLTKIMPLKWKIKNAETLLLPLNIILAKEVRQLFNSKAGQQEDLGVLWDVKVILPVGSKSWALMQRSTFCFLSAGDSLLRMLPCLKPNRKGNKIIFFYCIT